MRYFHLVLCLFLPLPALSQIAPYVHLADPANGAGCAAPADPSGVNSSQCEWNNAVKAAEVQVPGLRGYRALYIDPGLWYLPGNGVYGAATVLSKRISVVGPGQSMAAVLLPAGGNSFLSYENATDCNGMIGPCTVSVNGFAVFGRGAVSTGNAINVINTIHVDIADLSLVNFRGAGLNFVGGSERETIRRVNIQATGQPIVEEGDTDENDFEDDNILSSGADLSNNCYENYNCNPTTHQPLPSGTVVPNPHVAVKLDGVVNRWLRSSVKSTFYMGGVQCSPEGCQVDAGYAEGDAPYNVNAGYVFGQGKGELSHLAATISSTQTTIPVDDARWQTPYVPDPAEVSLVSPAAGRNVYFIFPLDYDVTQTGPSQYVPGVKRNQSETVSVQAFSADGLAHLIGPRSGIAWPKGSIMEQAPRQTYGSAQMVATHSNSVDEPVWTSILIDGCNDTAQLPLTSAWTSSRSELCSEVIDGPVPDGYAVPFIWQHYAYFTAALHLIDSTFYFNTNADSEMVGAGWIKIPGNGTVQLDMGNGHLVGQLPAATATSQYINGLARVAFVTDQGATALGQIMDPSAGYMNSRNNNILSVPVDSNGVTTIYSHLF